MAIRKGIFRWQLVANREVPGSPEVTESLSPPKHNSCFAQVGYTEAMTTPEGRGIKEISDKPHEACGIVGFAPKSEDPIELASLGLISIHNRGEDGTGIAVFNPDLTIVKNLGKSERAFKGGSLLEGLGQTAVALGHVHYNTDEANPERSLQPYGQNDFAFAHNGQLTNARALASVAGIEINGDSDSEIFSKLLAKKKNALGSLELALDEVLPKVSGAFSIAIAEKDRIIAARDRKGWRPLSIGRLADGGYGVSSESAIFGLLGGEFIGSVGPGTFVILDRDKAETYRWSKMEPATCGLEYAYFSRTDSEIDGVGVGKARYHMGELLGQDHPKDIDLVIPMPDSGRHAATGYADELELPHADGFYRNHDMGRIYIKSKSRRHLARIKNNPIDDVVNNKRVAVVDDSTIRGNTAGSAIQALRESGALEVHWLSAFPKVVNDCYYGMNMRQRDGFVATDRSDDEIAQVLGADSVSYLSAERFEEAVGRIGSLCMACSTNQYPEQVTQEILETERVPH